MSVPMKRAAIVLAVLLVPFAGLAAGAAWLYRSRGWLACVTGWRRHDPVREMTAAGPIYRCRRCGATAATVMELLDPHGEDGRVSVERFDQRARLHGSAEPEPSRGRFLRGHGFTVRNGGVR